MAQEAKIRVKLDVEEGRRELKRLKDDMKDQEKSAKDMAAAISSGVGRGLALAAGLAGAIDKGVGGGFLDTLGATLGGFAGNASRQVGRLLGDRGNLQEGVSQNVALSRAIDTVKGLVSAGGSITDDQMKGLITQFQQLYLPGQRNVQQADVAGQELRVTQALGRAAEKIDAAANNLKGATGGGGR